MNETKMWTNKAGRQVHTHTHTRQNGSKPTDLLFTLWTKMTYFRFQFSNRIMMTLISFVASSKQALISIYVTWTKLNFVVDIINIGNKMHIIDLNMKKKWNFTHVVNAKTNNEQNENVSIGVFFLQTKENWNDDWWTNTCQVPVDVCACGIV